MRFFRGYFGILKMKVNHKILLFFILAGILFRFATLGIQGFWYDEARQFTIAKGIPVSSLLEGDPKLVNTSLASLSKLTLVSFLGSPFFTVMLHYWSKVSNSEVWLRLLPLFFSIGVLPIMYRLALACKFSKGFALFVTAFCSWVRPWVFYSIELRPYSLEVFCVALSLFLFVNIIRNKGAPVLRYLWLSLSMLVGIVSGYGYIIVCLLIAICAVFFIITTDDILRRRIIKAFLVIIPVIVYFLYVNYIISIPSIFIAKTRLIDLALRISTEYLPYLYQSFHSSLGVYAVSIVKSVLSMISWQLFDIGKINLGFFNNAPMGLLFFLLAGIVFFCIIFLVFLLLKRKRYEEGVVLVIFLGAVVACVILSTLRVFPIGPIRQNLFLSPVLLMSFFIFLRYFYKAVNRIWPRINWNYCVLLIFISMITLNLLRTSNSLVYGRNGEEIRPLLKRIERSYRQGDRICVYLNKRSVHMFVYEWQYASFPWMNGLQRKDIYEDPSFKAGAGSGYNYQLYLFAGDHELANNVRKSLVKNGVSIEEEYKFISGVGGFKARINSEKTQAVEDVIVVSRPKKICQLVGEVDRELGIPTINRTFSRYGLSGTDLGVSFKHNGRIYLLFGDTFGKGPAQVDTIAYTTDFNLEDGLKLEFIHNADGGYRPIKIPGISQGSFEVPVEGVSVNGKMYIYHTTDSIPGGSPYMGRSVAAVSDDNGYVFKYLYDFSKRHFINISIVQVNPRDWQGLPEGGSEGLVIFGTGSYRRSNVKLAFQPASRIESSKAIRYFAGLDGSGKPRWSFLEDDSQPLFQQPSLGELSVSYNKFIHKWIMLYNCSSSQNNEFRGINMRTADKPWGPWSDSQVIFEPWRDGGYCHFMHTSWESRKCDVVSDPQAENEWGGEYGPYQFEDFAVGDNSITTIYFTMSTWNPYTVVLMKATLKRAQ